MTDKVAQSASKRKVLSLKLQVPATQAEAHLPQFVANEHAVFMVWRDGGDMPTRVYRSNEKSIAISHAKALAADTGERFYVMRAWRGFDGNKV